VLTTENKIFLKFEGPVVTAHFKYWEENWKPHRAKSKPRWTWIDDVKDWTKLDGCKTIKRATDDQQRGRELAVTYRYCRH